MAGRQSIKMSYAESNAAAASMRKEADQMKDALDAAANEIITCIESSWGGRSGATVKGAIEGLQKTFQTFQDAVYTYAQFVDDAVTAWKTTDEKTETAAANLTSGFTSAGANGPTSVFTATDERP